MLKEDHYLILDKVSRDLVHDFHAESLLEASRLGKIWLRKRGLLTGLYIIERWEKPRP